MPVFLTRRQDARSNKGYTCDLDVSDKQLIPLTALLSDQIRDPIGRVRRTRNVDSPVLDVVSATGRFLSIFTSGGNPVVGGIIQVAGDQRTRDLVQRLEQFSNTQDAVTFSPWSSGAGESGLTLSVIRSGETEVRIPLEVAEVDGRGNTKRRFDVGLVVLNVELRRSLLTDTVTQDGLPRFPGGEVDLNRRVLVAGRLANGAAQELILWDALDPPTLTAAEERLINLTASLPAAATVQQITNFCRIVESRVGRLGMNRFDRLAIKAEVLRRTPAWSAEPRQMAFRSQSACSTPESRDLVARMGLGNFMPGPSEGAVAPPGS